ncbi:tartronate semialdehyde reductase [Paenibacillus sambharensis]|uniref:Tartronate semialdehyde reductase n=1 Tax=Paenibacillus sambharensis TaxID=1803190 RepID=A0A2W1LSV3_9BACL|nr:tartronate semialdehyde reductase [Paenibacillus sambharensis]
MQTVGFIGLGTMGGPMAENLLRKGYQVTVYNRTPGKSDELLASGANAAQSPLEVARTCELIFTMISNDQAIDEVYYGSEGILNGLQPDTIVVDSSTISPALARRLAADIAEKHADFLDAPVTGSKPAAIDGTLVFMVGGDKEIVRRVEPAFLSMGREVIYMGSSGSGATAKLAHNTIVGINAAGLIEGMAIAAKGGINGDSFLRLVQSGGAASKQADLKGRKILEHDFSVQFSLALMLKDLKLSSVLTDTLGVSTPMLEASKSLFQLGQSAGHGELDLAALAYCYEEWIGRRIGGEEQDSGESQPPQGGERRRKARLSLDIPLMMSVYQWEQEGAFSGQSIVGSLRDLSEGGLQVATTYPLEMDMFVVIHFQNDANLPPITARIIRIEQHDDLFYYGCMLSGIPLYQRQQLEQYIDRKLAEKN